MRKSDQLKSAVRREDILYNEDAYSSFDSNSQKIKLSKRAPKSISKLNLLTSGSFKKSISSSHS